MTKNELIGCIAEKSGLAKKNSAGALNAIVDAITTALVEGDKVQLTGFGAFEVKERPERKDYSIAFYLWYTEKEKSEDVYISKTMIANERKKWDSIL